MNIFAAVVETSLAGSLDTNDVLRPAFDVCVRKPQRNIQQPAKLCAANPALVDCVWPLLLRLCREDYPDATDGCREILKNAYGSRVADSSRDDYFLMEALAREFGASDGWW